MACEEYQDQIPLLRRGELDPGPAASLRAHLEACPQCRAAFDEEEALTAALSLATRHAAPFGLRERVAAAIRLQGVTAAERPGQRWPAWLWRPLLPAAVGAALGVLVSVPLTWWVASRPPAPIIVLVRQAAQEQERVVHTRLWEQGLRAPEEALPHLATWLGIPFPKPPMAGGDLTLVGAKPTYFFGRKAGVFVYEDKAGRLVTLLVFPGEDVQIPEGGRVQVDRFRPYFSAAEGYTLCVWKQKDVGFSMVGKISQEEMAQAFLKIRRGL
jgi:anti-sigma factor (TIGR02949 family)